MADTNLFDELKETLDDFKQFLDENVPTIRPAIQAIAGLIPQVNDLVDLLIELMNKLKTEIQNLDVSTIPGLDEVSSFTEKVTGLLESARKLLPDDTAVIDEVADVADVVTSLPSLDAVKNEIVALIDAINTHLNSLKA